MNVQLLHSILIISRKFQISAPLKRIKPIKMSHNFQPCLLVLRGLIRRQVDDCSLKPATTNNTQALNTQVAIRIHKIIKD
jgi:hypothetical protein